MGTTPIGGLVVGWIIDARSPRAAIALGGIAPLLCAVVLVGLSGRGRETTGYDPSVEADEGPFAVLGPPPEAAAQAAG
jgi:hypothetical protein